LFLTHIASAIGESHERDETTEYQRLSVQVRRDAGKDLLLRRGELGRACSEPGQRLRGGGVCYTCSTTDISAATNGLALDHQPRHRSVARGALKCQ
jgi:hypothetical protein